MKRKILIVLSLFFMFLATMPLDVTYGKEFTNKENYEKGEFNRSSFANDGERFFYRLEAGMPDEDKANFFNIAGKTTDAIYTALNETVMLVNRVIFLLNVKFSGWTIGLLESTQDFKFIDNAIEGVSNEVKKLVGISGTSFTSGGMLSTLFKLIALVVIVYSFYQLVWKRSFISSFGEMAKFVVVLTISLLLFTNYNTFLSGMNNISTEIGRFVVGSQADQSGHNTRVDAFSQSLWNHLVDKPYLTLQYGTDNLNELSIDGKSGESRIQELLTSRTGSKDRKKLIDKEINDRENYYMSYDSVPEKTYMTLVFFGLNSITSIPVLLIALAIMFTQFWFVIMALIAPFALLIASIPSQFNVLKRYFFELSLPLLIKIGLHFALVVIMFLTTILSSVHGNISSDFFGGQIGASFINTILYIMLFIGIFLLRKRIAGVLTSGSNTMREVREGLGGLTTKPFKDAVQTSTTAVGAGIGYATGGPAGAVAGANAGATVGKVLTGESDGVAGTVQDVRKAGYQYEMLKHFKENDKNSNADNFDLTAEQQIFQANQELEIKEKEERGLEATNDFLDEQGFGDKEKDAYIKAMNKQGVDFSKVSPNTLDRYYNNENGMKNPRDFAQSIKEHQINEGAKLRGLKTKRIEQFNTFLKDQNLNENEINDINSHLESKAIDVAHIPTSDYVELDKNIRNRLVSGELLDYKEEFKTGLEQKAQAHQLEQQKDRIMKSHIPKHLDSHNDLPTAKLEMQELLKKSSSGSSPPQSNWESLEASVPQERGNRDFIDPRETDRSNINELNNSSYNEIAENNFDNRG